MRQSFAVYFPSWVSRLGEIWGEKGLDKILGTTRVRQVYEPLWRV
jgi:hypothetical protein